MRYICLLIVVAIIYIASTRMESPVPGDKDGKPAVTQGMDAANPDNPSMPGATPAAHTDALKAPLDRTQEVLDQARKQKTDDQF